MIYTNNDQGGQGEFMEKPMIEYVIETNFVFYHWLDYVEIIIHTLPE